MLISVAVRQLESEPLGSVLSTSSSPYLCGKSGNLCPSLSSSVKWEILSPLCDYTVPPAHGSTSVSCV